MTEIALFDAKNRLSELIDRLQAGEVFTITRRGKPVAQLALPGADDAGAATARGLDAVARLRASREGLSLGGLRSRDLITQGRR
jgi:antitoxin (DNA-binding transcriptional repressor) of toxin-antitoxin stability system